MGKEVKKYGAKGFFAWIFSVSFFILTLSIIFTSVITAFMYFIMGLIIFPPFTKYLKKKHNIELSTGLKITIIILLFYISVSGFSENFNEAFNEGLKAAYGN